MATMYIKDVNEKWHKIDVGRIPTVTIHFDYGGCTGHTMLINMEDLWCTNTDICDFYPADLRECITTDIGGVKIDGEEVE